MYKRFFFAFCLGIFLCSLLVFNSARAVDVIIGFSHPESITIDPTSNRVFVSNIGEEMNPTAKDGDGFISEVAANGSVVQQHWTPEGILDAPKGLAIIDDVIYTADIDRVVGFDLNSSQEVFSLDLSAEANFLNDLVVIDNNTLLVSASDRGTVYQINLDKRKYSALPGYVPGANGITYNVETNTVYAVGLGENFNGEGNLYRLAFSDPDAQFELINSATGFLDGVTLTDDTHLLYSDWVDIAKPTLGAIYSYDLSTQQTNKLTLPEEIRSPADFYYKDGFLWIPQTIDNQVAIADISQQVNSDLLLLPDSIAYPNGIAVTQDGSMYVGSVTTGAVAKINLQTSESELLVEPQTAIIASTSLRADEAEGILWACSPDVFPNQTERQPSILVALDINTGEVIKTVTLPQDGFCNDLAIDDLGGVLVTDSFNPRVLYLPPDGTEFKVWLWDERLGVSEGFGLSGIANASDETVYVSVFASGQLYRIRNNKVEPLQLSRQISNPDGMAIAPDGSLIVCEGNYQTGNGRLLQINLSDDLTGEIQVLAEGLDSPVNLSLDGESVWLTEGRLRSLLRPELNLPEPDSFWVRYIILK